MAAGCFPSFAALQEDRERELVGACRFELPRDRKVCRRWDVPLGVDRDACGIRQADLALVEVSHGGAESAEGEGRVAPSDVWLVTRAEYFWPPIEED